MSTYRRAKFFCQDLGFVWAAVDQSNVCHTCIGQGPNDGAGGTTRAQDHSSSLSGLPTWLRFMQTLYVTEGICVGAAQTAVWVDHDRIDRPDLAGHIIQLVHTGQGVHLVRQCEVTSCKTQG